MTTTIRRRELAALAAAAGLGAALPAGAAESLPRRYEGTTLSILSRSSPAFDAVTALGGEFTEATGIKLAVTRVAPSDQYAKLMLDLTSNTNAFDVTLFVYQWKHELAPFLGELAGADKLVAGAPGLALDDYPPKLLEVYGKVGDKLMGLPIVGDVAFFLWNREALRAAGLPDGPPKSWDEVVERGRKLTGGGKFGFALPAGKTPQCAVLWTLLFHAFGGNYFDAAGAPALASPAGVQTMRFMAESLESVSPTGNLTWDYNEVMNSFSTAQSAQAVIWPGAFSILADPAKSAVAGKFGLAPPPGGSLLGGTSIGVNAKSTKAEAARLYVLWITSPGIVRRNAMSGTAPARLSALADPALVAKYPYFPDVKAAMLGDTFGYIPMKEAEQVNMMVADEANAAVAKSKPPEQAAHDLQDKVTQFMKRRGYLH